MTFQDRLPRLTRDALRSPRFWFWAGGVLFVVIACVILRKMEHPWEGLTGWKIRMGKPWKPVDYGRFYSFWMGLAATVSIGVMVLSSRWWWPWAHPTAAPPGSAVPASWGRRGWLVLALIVAGSAWLRGQHLDRQVYRDEQDTLRYHVHGYYQVNRQGDGLEFVSASWPDAAFGNRYGNNPVLMSILSRAALEGWWWVSGEPRDRYHPAVVRFPGFLAGLASIVALAWCLNGFAPARVALLGAAVAAMHPVHADYCIQARGYAYVLLGVPLALGGAVRALQSGRWRDWIALVGGSVITLYAYLGGLFLIAPLALTTVGVVLGRIWSRRRLPVLRPLAVRDLLRLAVVGSVGVALYLTAALPSLMGFLEKKEAFPRMFPVDWTWWVAMWTQYAGGRILSIPTQDSGAPVALAHAFREVVAPQPLLWLGMVLVALVAVAGLIRLWRRGPASTRLLMTVAAASPFLQIGVHFGVTKMVLFAYYLIYWLPPLICLFAVGLDGILERIAESRLFGGSGGSPSRLAWGSAALVALAVLYCTVGIGTAKGLNVRSRPSSQPSVFTRSTFNWISYPDGRTLKWDAKRPVPGTFSPEQGMSQFP